MIVTSRIASVFAGAVLLLTSAAVGCGPRQGSGPEPAGEVSAPGRSTTSTVYPSAGGGTDVPEWLGDDGVVGEPTPPPVQPAQRVAEAFLHAWARPGLDQGSWLAGLAPYAAPAYLRRLRSVDPANVPAHAVTGAAVLVGHDDVLAVFDIPTDAGEMRVTCLAIDGGWRVASVEPGRPRPVPDPPRSDTAGHR